MAINSAQTTIPKPVASHAADACARKPVDSSCPPPPNLKGNIMNTPASSDLSDLLPDDASLTEVLAALLEDIASLRLSITKDTQFYEAELRYRNGITFSVSATNLEDLLIKTLLRKMLP